MYGPPSNYFELCCQNQNPEKQPKGFTRRSLFIKKLTKITRFLTQSHHLDNIYLLLRGDTSTSLSNNLYNYLFDLGKCRIFTAFFNYM